MILLALNSGMNLTNVEQRLMGAGFYISQQPDRELIVSLEEEVAFHKCLRCDLAAICREATATTGEVMEPGNCTCHAVNENLPLILVRQ